MNYGMKCEARFLQEAEGDKNNEDGEDDED